MRHRFAFFAVLAALVLTAAGCAGDASSGQAAAPATTAAAPGPTTAPPTTHTETTRHAPEGLVPTGRREPAPGLRVTAFDGSTVTLDQFRGRPAVVSFFESWCPICQAEQPDLSKVAKEFAGRAGFVGVSNHDTVAAGRAYARRFDVTYPMANDASGKTWARWGVPYQPVTVLIDKQGRIAERFDGGTTGGTLRAALAYLAAE